MKEFLRRSFLRCFSHAEVPAAACSTLQLFCVALFLFAALQVSVLQVSALQTHVEKQLGRARELMREAGFRIGMSDGGLVSRPCLLSFLTELTC